MDVANYFTLSPACDYDISYTVQLYPEIAGADPFYSQEVENSSTWWISSDDASLDNMYNFDVTVHLIDYPTDAPFNDGTGINTSGSNHVVIAIDLIDLCSSEDNVLKFDIKEDTIDSDYDYETDPIFELFAIIGSRNKTSGSALYSRTYPGYKDEITMEFSGA